MTQTTPATEEQPRPLLSETAAMLARTSETVLTSAFGELTSLMKALDRREPMRARLGEIGSAMQSAIELNRRLVNEAGSMGQRSERRIDRAAMVALLVESNDSLRGLMGEVIRRHGYTVLEARTAEEAERVVAMTPFLVDKLVTEVLVSGSSGLALGSRLRALRPEMGIIYTVNEAHEAVVPRGAMGLGTVLKKPFSVAGLADALRGEVAA